MTTPAHLTDAVDALRTAGHIDRAHVERALGTPLTRDGDGGPFARYVAKDVRIGDAAMTVELREPVPGSGATAGALLNLRITHGCPAKRDIEARYGPLTVSNLPRGRSLEETTGMSREEPWGRVTFGFAERSPDCLAAVTFAAK